MNTNTVTSLAAAGIAPKILRSVGLRGIIFAAVAYYGLKYLSKKGVLPKQADAALGFVDHGIDMAKEKLGFEPSYTPKSAKKLSSKETSIH